MTHIQGPECAGCEAKLAQAHPRLAQWYREKVKARNSDAHISWSFRDEESQNQAVAEGKSKLLWPHSRHNKMDADGNPCAEALDLFQIPPSGNPIWSVSWFHDLASAAVDQKDPILWGGQFHQLGDFDHFQLIE